MQQRVVLLLDHLVLLLHGLQVRLHGGDLTEDSFYHRDAFSGLGTEKTTTFLTRNDTSNMCKRRSRTALFIQLME